MIQDSNGILDYNDQGELLLDGHVIKVVIYQTLYTISYLVNRGLNQEVWNSFWVG